MIPQWMSSPAKNKNKTYSKYEHCNYIFRLYRKQTGKIGMQ